MANKLTGDQSLLPTRSPPSSIPAGKVVSWNDRAVMAWIAAQAAKEDGANYMEQAAAELARRAQVAGKPWTWTIFSGTCDPAPTALKPEKPRPARGFFMFGARAIHGRKRAPPRGHSPGPHHPPPETLAHVAGLFGVVAGVPVPPAP